MRYRYEFVTRSEFAPAVGWHFFKLRVQPMESVALRCVSGCVEVAPHAELGHAVDAFGNRVIYGSVGVGHDFFEVRSTGVVVCDEGVLVRDDAPGEFYRYASGLTGWDAVLRERVWGLDAVWIMHVVHGSLGYERFVTDNATSALGALRGGRGVCQDFAHVMIAACRSVGMLARYVCGLIVGEGESHAWVEVYVDGAWQPLDPTYDRRVGVGYIKIAHGRDAGDCALNRGRFFGVTSEFMCVKCCVDYDSNCDFA